MKTGNSIIEAVIDTEILLKYYQDEEGADKIEKILNKVDSEEIKAIISTMTLSEVYYVVSRINKNMAEEIFTDLVNSNLRIVGVGKEIAKLAGVFKHKYSKAKDPLPIADAIIAATAKIEKVSLLAEDPHFDKIKEVDVMSIDGLQ